MDACGQKRAGHENDVGSQRRHGETYLTDPTVYKHSTCYWIALSVNRHIDIIHEKSLKKV